jgi:hypothetical protein
MEFDQSSLNSFQKLQHSENMGLKSGLCGLEKNIFKRSSVGNASADTGWVEPIRPVGGDNG